MLRAMGSAAVAAERPWAAVQAVESRQRDQPWAVPLRRSPVVRDWFGVARWQRAWRIAGMAQAMRCAPPLCVWQWRCRHV
jgi:hypothetical protein